MLNPGKKIRALRDKKINILTFVLSEKKILNETKNHNPRYFYVAILILSIIRKTMCSKQNKT
jgi:hypothetical protein